MAEVRGAHDADGSEKRVSATPGSDPERRGMAYTTMRHNDPDRDNGHDQEETRGDSYWQHHRKQVLDQHGFDTEDEQ